MSDWDESKHKRDRKGKFAKTSDGAGGEHEETPAETERLKAHGIDSGISLSKQEYAVLRAEVMRKNAAQRGKVKPMNCAFTSNGFYVYSTSGDDSFVPLVKLDIEEDGERIDYFMKKIGGV